MAKHRDFDPNDILYASWTDAIQEFVGSAVIGLRLTCPTVTSVRAAAAADSAQVAVGVDGRWRYRTSNYDVTISGGSGTKSLWAVAVTENDFVGAGLDPDETDYNFELRMTTGAAPGSVIASRKIGEVDWDGSKITGLRQTAGAVDATLPGYPIAPTIDSPALVAQGIASQVADIFQVKNSAGTVLFKVTAAGDVNAVGDFTFDDAVFDDLTVDDLTVDALTVATIAATGQVGFNGQAPAARPDYTVTNHSTDRAYNANSTTINELGDVLGTVIADLIAIGLFQ